MSRNDHWSFLWQVAVWIIIIVTTFSLLILWAGCTMVHSAASPPTVRSMLLVLPVDETYARARHAAGQMGATIRQEDRARHTFLATTPQQVGLHVHVESTAEGTELTVSAAMLPEHVGLGPMTEADTFLATFHRSRAWPR